MGSRVGLGILEPSFKNSGGKLNTRQKQVRAAKEADLEEAEGSLATGSLLHVTKGPGQQECQLGVAGLVSVRLPQQSCQQLEAVLSNWIACFGHALQQACHCLASTC